MDTDMFVNIIQKSIGTQKKNANHTHADQSDQFSILFYRVRLVRICQKDLLRHCIYVIPFILFDDALNITNSTYKYIL